MEVRTELAVIQRSASTAKADAEAAVAQMEKRQRERTAEDERRLQAIAQRLEGLSTGLTSLAGRLDELNTRTEALGRQMRGATAVPAPLPPTATNRPTAPAPAPAPVEPTPGSRPSTNALQPQDIYQAAYIDFSKGSYPLAVAGFREFLRRFPEHALAGNAQYWIGEGYFSQARAAANAGQNERVAQELEQAVQEYRKVL